MRRLSQNISLLAVSVFTVGALATVPVYARDGSGESTSTGTTATTSTGGTTEHSTSGGSSGSGSSTTSTTSTSGKRIETNTVGTNTETETDSHDGVSSEAEVAEVHNLRGEAEKLLETKRHESKTKSVAERQKSCDAHKAELTTRRDNYERNAQRHLDTFNGIYAKVLAFQAKKQMHASNFDSLKATADAKKAAATSAVAALSDASVTVDCTTTDPAANVATLKTAVANVRSALQEYRTAIKNVIVALQAVKTTETTNAADTPSSSTEAN